MEQIRETHHQLKANRSISRRDADRQRRGRGQVYERYPTRREPHDRLWSQRCSEVLDVFGNERLLRGSGQRV